MIFIDSNVPMYLAGPDNPLKVQAWMAVEWCIGSGDRLVTDAEVIQEIVHRYSAQRRFEIMEPAIRYLLRFADDVFPVDRRDALRAAELVRHPRQFSARDAIHIAVMESHGVDRILSFDSDFDHWPGITRIWQV